MLLLKWRIINNEWQTTYKGFTIRACKPQKWTNTSKRNRPYFKLLHPNQTQAMEYSTDFYSLIVRIEKYKGK